MPTPERSRSTEVGDLAWRTVAEVLQRLQLDLDRDWELEEMARLSGYEIHHFAHLFRAVVGVPPRNYVRRLRLERAACELIDDPTAALIEIAGRAGYTSPEAFTRAFRRAFRAPPIAFRERATKQVNLSPGAPRTLARRPLHDTPEGLDAEAEIVAIGPLRAWTIVMSSFDDMEAVQSALFQLAAAKPPDGPWQLGGISQPWGWATGAGRLELRCMRLVEDDARPPAPIMPWRMPRGWFARFTYEGPLDRVYEVCAWIMNRWIPESGLRAAFAPLFSLLGAMLDERRAQVRLHAPIRQLG